MKGAVLGYSVEKSERDQNNRLYKQQNKSLKNKGGFEWRFQTALVKKVTSLIKCKMHKRSTLSKLFITCYSVIFSWANTIFTYQIEVK